MDGTSMDSIFMSAYPIEQFFPEENTNKFNKSLVEEGLNIDSGAGANAGPGAEITFVTNNPLSELVWSPRKGISLKCAECNLSKRKSSLFWSSESGNMIVSSRISIKGWECRDNAIVAERSLGSMPLEPNPGCENSHRETSAKSPTCIGAASPGLIGHVEPLATVKLVSADVSHDVDDQSAKKYSPRDTQNKIDLYKEIAVTPATLPDKASLPDRVSGKCSSLSVKPEEDRYDVLPAEPEHEDFTKGVSSELFGRRREVSHEKLQRESMVNKLVFEASMDKQYKLPGNLKSISRSPLRESDEEDLLHEGKDKNESVEIPFLARLESTVENVVEMLKMEGIRHSSLSKSEGVGGSDCGNMGMNAHHLEEVGNIGLAQNHEMPSTDTKDVPIEASPNNNERGGKEKSLSDTGVDWVITKEINESHESIKSHKSRVFLSKGKRANIFERKLLTGGKRVKKQHVATPHSASFIGEDRPLMNLVLTTVKGFPKHNPFKHEMDGMDGKPPIVHAPKATHQRNGKCSSYSITYDKGQEESGCSSTEFQNVLQALWHPSLPVEDKITEVHDDQTGATYSKEVEAMNKIPCDTISAHGNSNKDTETSQGQEFPSILPNISPANHAIIEEKTEDPNKNQDSCNLAFEFDKGGVVSSKSSFHDDSGSPPEGKAAREIGSDWSNQYSDLVTNKSKPIGSIWLSRFSPITSGPTNTVQLNQNIAAIEGLSNHDGLCPSSQNATVAHKILNRLEDSHKPSVECPLKAQCRNAQNHSISPPISCGSKRIIMQTDWKVKPKLNPALPSQHFKSSEGMFSIFARRLDALRHIIPMKVTDNKASVDTICFFCGTKSHSLKECSEAIKSEFKDLLKNINLCCGSEKVTCLCIRCLQHSHCAIACPHASSRDLGNNHGLASFTTCVQSDKEKFDPFNQCDSSRHNGKNMLQSGIRHQSCQLTDLNPIMKDHSGNHYHQEETRRRNSNEFLLMGKKTASSVEYGSIENQIIPFHNYMTRKIMGLPPNGTFEAIRKLRLSRKDIRKWTKSPISEFCLEGFFIRLRLGKWEEGLGGTGYHVASISGYAQERSCSACKLPISVDIGDLKCLVDCRYVSNHDFIEDELVAWWYATLRGDGKLPTVEDLNLKLLERRRYGI